MSLQATLDELLADPDPEKKLMLRLKFDISPQPIGPGKVDKYMGSYRITIPAMAQSPTGSKNILMPIIFDVADVLWLSEGPREAESSAIIKPGGGNVSQGGIHLV